MDDDDGFTFYSTKKRSTAPPKDHLAQRPQNGKRNHGKRRMNASNPSDSDKSPGFGKSQWAKPSQSGLSIHRQGQVNGKDGATHEQNHTEVLKESSVSILSPSLEGRILNSEIATVNGISDNFMSICQSQSLSVLMEEYGSYDPDWMKVPIPEPAGVLVDPLTCDPVETERIEPSSNSIAPPDAQPNQVGVNRLQTHGRAPIHVEFVSFGFRHGIPSEIRHHSTGNSYRQPLPPFDTRTVLAPVPPHLAWMDGKSSVVKSTMLRWQPTEAKNEPAKLRLVEEQQNVRDYAEVVLGRRVADALLDAMHVGGHGYASPLVMTIFVGSELGRHRSVVACELGATALRQRLRQNHGHRFQCAVSVGCRHRDIAQHSSHGNSVVSRKQKAFEED